MNHRKIRRNLSAYVDGELDHSEEKAVEAHLWECADCREALEALRQTIGHVKAVKEEAPPAWLTREIMEQVRAETDQAEPFWRKLIFPLHIKLPIEAVAMAFLVVMGAYLYQQLPADPRGMKAPTKLDTHADAPSAADAEIESRAPAADSADRYLQEKPSAGYRAAEPPSATSAGSAAKGRTRPPPSSSSATAGKSSPVLEEAAPTAQGESGALQTDSALRLPAGQLNLAVDDPNEAAAAVDEYLKKAGGTRLRTETQAGDVILTVKLPGPSLATFLAALNDLGRVRGEETVADLHGASVLRIILTDEDTRR